MERVRAALLSLIDTAWTHRGLEPRPSPFFLGTSSDWLGQATGCALQADVTAMIDAAWTEVAAVAGLARFLDTGSRSSDDLDPLRSSFRSSFVPHMLAYSFSIGGASYSPAIGSATVDSLMRAFKTNRASAVAHVFLLNCCLPHEENDAPLPLWPPNEIKVPPVTLDDGVILRTPTTDERRKLLQLAREDFSFARPSFGESEVDRTRAVLERRFEYDLPVSQMLADPSHHQRTGEMIDLIRVCTGRPAMAIARVWSPDGYPFFGGAWTWLSRRLYEPEGEEIRPQSLTDSLASFGHLEERERLGLHRYGVALERDDSTDRLIDFWVALEALLLPFREEGMGKLAASRVRQCLASSPSEGAEIEEFVEQSYGLRSAIVHGSPHDSRRIHEVAERTGELVRRSVLKLLAEPHVVRAIARRRRK